MSMAKRQMERQEDQERVAASIALEAGVLKICEIHEEIYTNYGDEEEAYIRGEELFNKRELQGLFSDLEELKDAIKHVIENSGMECGRCAKYAAE